MKDDKKKLPKEPEAPVEELTDEELKKVDGGGAFDNVPRVPEHDYTDDIRNRV